MNPQMMAMMQDPRLRAMMQSRMLQQLRKAQGNPLQPSGAGNRTSAMGFSPQTAMLNAAKGPQTKEDQLFLQSMPGGMNPGMNPLLKQMGGAAINPQEIQRLLQSQGGGMGGGMNQQLMQLLQQLGGGGALGL